MQALQKHLAPVLELETLAKQEFVQLVMHTQERVKAIKAEREKAAERKSSTRNDSAGWMTWCAWSA